MQNQSELRKVEWRIRRLVDVISNHEDKAFIHGARYALLWMLENSPNLKLYIQDQENKYNLPPIGKGKR